MVLLLLGGGAVGFVLFGRRLRSGTSGTSGTGSELSDLARRVCWSYAALITIVQGALQIYSMLPPNWDIAKSLPFQLCDLAWMAAVVALATRQAWACGLLYFWGLTLTSQALLTPFLERDFPHLEYIMFWFSHGAVVLAAIFVTWGLGFQLRWRHFAITIAATYIWGFGMIGFNAWAGTNYLYVSGKPPRKSILDALGPWPWYLVAEGAILFVAWALMTWPWTRKRRSVPTLDV